MMNGSTLIPRERHAAHIQALLDEFPVVAILGARQIGKTTLAKQIAARWSGRVTWFDLEDPQDLASLSDPGLELRPLDGLVVLDEIHRLPNVFPLLRVLADRPGPPARFLVLGSASPSLLKQTSESLAGRVGYYELRGLTLDEVDDFDTLWIRGGFPRAFLARSDATSRRWRDNFFNTFLARDIAEFGSTVSPHLLRRFWTMLAHWHGQRWNGSEFGRAFGVSHTTVRRYLDLLTSLYVVRQLQPWFENIRKRQVRSPKVYVADSGMLHALLGLPTRSAVVSHPKVGASWEGFVIEQVIHALQASAERCYHWGTHTGAEVDLVVLEGAVRRGFEAKRTEAPKLTPSMLSAVDTLGLDRLDVVHAGTRRYRLTEKIHATPILDVIRSDRQG